MVFARARAWKTTGPLENMTLNNNEEANKHTNTQLFYSERVKSGYVKKKCFSNVTSECVSSSDKDLIDSLAIVYILADHHRKS